GMMPTASSLASSPTAWAPMPSATRKTCPFSCHWSPSPASNVAWASWLLFRRMPTSVRLAYSIESYPITSDYPGRLACRSCMYATMPSLRCIVARPPEFATVACVFLVLTAVRPSGIAIGLSREIELPFLGRQGAHEAVLGDGEPGGLRRFTDWL